MQFSAFNAFCPFEIGDKVKNLDGKILTITGIAVIHYVGLKKVDFMYEFDNSGKYRGIKMDEQGGIKNG
jgi:hypothetical protein